MNASGIPGGFIMLARADMDELREAGDYPRILAVWCALNSEANRKRSTAAETPLSEIARLSGMSKPTVLRTLDSLEAAGFIQVQRKAASQYGRPVNRYQLLRGKHATLNTNHPQPGDDDAYSEEQGRLQR